MREMEFWCEDHSCMVRTFDFAKAAQYPRYCPQGGARCRLSWRNVETVDFNGASN